jgi:5-methylcytosine-specific restriction protein B
LRNKVIPLLMEYFSGKTEIISGIFDGSGWNVNYDTTNYLWNVTKT